MAATPARRPSWVVLALVAAVVAAVLLVGIGGGDDDAPGSAGGAGEAPSATAEPSPEPTVVTPEEFCASFLAFAEASNTTVASPGVTSAQALVDASRTLFEMPTPLGMTDGARAALDLLVAGSLTQVATVPGVTVDTAPDPAYDAEPDQAAFDEYLQVTCPA